MICQKVWNFLALLGGQHHSRSLPFHDHWTVLGWSLVDEFVVCLGTVFVRFVEPLFQVFFGGDDLPEKICKSQVYGSVAIYSVLHLLIRTYRAVTVLFQASVKYFAYSGYVLFGFSLMDLAMMCFSPKLSRMNGFRFWRGSIGRFWRPVPARPTNWLK